MIKMYKPNGEHIDYMGQLQASKYELIPVLLRNFVATNVFGESITHPCINFECEYYRLMRKKYDSTKFLLLKSSYDITNFFFEK